MSRARAPGKLVVSGAYAVLSGAPAIVVSAGRYALADSERPAALVTDEVAAALTGGERAPFFDASALREGDRKLGLGSSAAILLASLFATARAGGATESDEELRLRLFPRALAAHRQAQAGGSGVDVASSCFGGVLVYRLGAALPELRAVELPRELRLEVWVCPTSASTRQLLAAVAGLREHSPDVHAQWLSAQAAAAVRAVDAVDQHDARAFIAALSDQHRALLGLGSAAGVPIVTPELAGAFALARAQGAALLPAGAGGGDIALFAGLEPSSSELRAVLHSSQHWLLDVPLAVAGVGPA